MTNPAIPGFTVAYDDNESHYIVINKHGHLEKVNFYNFSIFWVYYLFV